MDDRMNDQIHDTCMFLIDLQTIATLWLSSANPTRKEDGELLKQFLIESKVWCER